LQPFPCPYDTLPLSDLLWAGLDVRCDNCGFWYRATRGKAVRRQSVPITLQRQTSKRDGLYQRRYAVEVECVNGTRRTFEWLMAGRDEAVHIRQGDEVAFVEAATSAGVVLVGAGTTWPWSMTLLADFDDGAVAAGQSAAYALVVGLLVLWVLDGLSGLNIGIVGAVALASFFHAKERNRVKPAQFSFPGSADVQASLQHRLNERRSSPPDLPFP
jgi:hypothetical protein